MEIIYSSNKTKSICTSINKATALFGGNKALAVSLLARINALQKADYIKDIILMPSFHFHKLTNKKGRDLEGLFSIDVKSRKDPWRIVLQPLDDNENPFVPCNIDEISDKVRIVCITEVSKHYE